MHIRLNSICILCFSLFWGCLFAYIFLDRNVDNSTLKLVHLIFRHGDRNPDIECLYPSGPYYDEKYYPEGYGQLTNAGKQREFNLGLHLRNRYDSFLGQTWNVKDVDARTTYYDRTKMSLELVLAGLYPPVGKQAWSSMNWQPIPYSYLPMLEDKELLAYYACPNYIILMDALNESPPIVNYLQRYNETFEILNKNIQKKISFVEAFYLYLGFAPQEQLGYPLEDWTKALYPEPLHSLSVDMYYLMTNTTAIRRIISGYFLKKVLADTRGKIDGTLNPPQRKLFLYSAHEMTLATLILSMEALKLSTVPNYASYIVFEVHEINKITGIKIFYQNYEESEPIPLKLPGCDYFCPYEKFYQTLEEIIPVDDNACFNASWAVMESTKKKR